MNGNSKRIYALDSWTVEKKARGVITHPYF